MILQYVLSQPIDTVETNLEEQSKIVARKYDAFAVVLLGVDVNAANEDGVAAVEKYKEHEAADVGDPAGEFLVARDQPQVQHVPDATPNVHRAQEAEQQEAIGRDQTGQALKASTRVPHQWLQGKRHRHYHVSDGLQLHPTIVQIYIINIERNYWQLRIIHFRRSNLNNIP